MSRQRLITLDLVREALSFIPPDIGHDDRVRVAFAVFDGLGDDGASAWLDWAAGRSAADPAEDRDTWKSARKPGKIRVGTLFGIAKDHGFRFPAEGEAAAAPDPAALAAAAAERERRHRIEEAQHRERSNRAARDARQLWQDAAPTGHSPYLDRKGVMPHGVRFLPDGTLLVPMHDAAGELQNLQRIAPQRPADGGADKRYLPGGRKAGLWHWISAPARQADAAEGDGTSADTDTGPAARPVLLLAEGYATGASLHAATGWPVAVCFDAGNQRHVAEALRAQHPAALLLVCGDDDRDTEARGKGNAGRKWGAAAARAGGAAAGLAAVVFPEGLPEGGSDFNDLHASAGLDEVRRQIEAAAAVLRAAAAGAPADAMVPADPASAAGMDDAATGPEHAKADDPAPAEAEAPAAPAKRAKGRKSARTAASAGGADTGDSQPFDRFRVDDSGVWYTPPANSDDGSSSGPRRVCDRLEVMALARDLQDRSGALLLEFDTAFGRGRRWLMPLAMLAGDGAAYRAELLDMGFLAPTDQHRRRWLTEYLQSRRPAERVRLVDRVGWHGTAYVLPRETLQAPLPEGEPAESMLFHSDAPAENTFTQRGTLAQWQERIGRLCRGNSRLMFSASAALAGPVLAWVTGMESGGFHFRGDSSCGKTTALRVGASVWGGRDYLQRWRATDNGLEAQAAQHSDGLLVLDELGQIDPKVAGESAYMLANGQGKARAGRTGAARPRLTWRLLWLSAGELPLSDHMAEAGKRMRAGQELRMVDMPADAGCGLGLFETLHDFEGGAALAQHLAKACEQTHGTLGRAWLEWLTGHAGDWHAELRQLVERITLELVPDTADGQVQRAGRRFALVAAAGELATRQGLTGWAEGEPTAAARACFLAWVGARPAGFGSSEETEALRQVRAFLEKNGDALFTWWHRAMDDHKPNTALRAGFRRLTDDQGQPVKFDSADDYCDARSPEGRRSADDALIEYLVFPEAFKRDVCKGLDARFVAGVLREAGHLKHEPGRETVRHRLPGTGRIKSPVFHILPTIFEGEEG
jgi:putative DNA primase/helicase